MRERMRRDSPCAAGGRGSDRANRAGSRARRAAGRRQHGQERSRRRRNRHSRLTLAVDDARDQRSEIVLGQMLDRDPAGQRFLHLLDVHDERAGERPVGEEALPFVGMSARRSATIASQPAAVSVVVRSRPVQWTSANLGQACRPRRTGRRRSAGAAAAGAGNRRHSTRRRRAGSWRGNGGGCSRGGRRRRRRARARRRRRRSAGYGRRRARRDSGRAAGSRNSRRPAR